MKSFFWLVKFLGITIGEHTFIGGLKRIVERLYNFGEVRSKRKLGDNMREVHFYPSLSVNLEQAVRNTYDYGPHARNLRNHDREW
jgi:hypothetical protein